MVVGRGAPTPAASLKRVRLDDADNSLMKQNSAVPDLSPESQLVHPAAAVVTSSVESPEMGKIST